MVKCEPLERELHLSIYELLHSNDFGWKFKVIGTSVLSYSQRVLVEGLVLAKAVAESLDKPTVHIFHSHLLLTRSTQSANNRKDLKAGFKRVPTNCCIY